MTDYDPYWFNNQSDYNKHKPSYYDYPPQNFGYYLFDIYVDIWTEIYSSYPVQNSSPPLNIHGLQHVTRVRAVNAYDAIIIALKNKNVELWQHNQRILEENAELKNSLASTNEANDVKFALKLFGFNSLPNKIQLKEKRSKLAKTAHPDKNKNADQELIQLINEAYNTLIKHIK